MKEFHNLEEKLLNAESSYQTLWGNLGYWYQAQTYPEACLDLADMLASTVQLSHEDTLVDIGFGCGDQLLHWLSHYHVKHLYGLNISVSQTAFAKQRLIHQEFNRESENLFLGSADCLPKEIKKGISHSTTIVALDCAYHFPSRYNFLEEVASLAPSNCRLGLTDIVLAREPKTFEKLVLTTMLKLSKIPSENLVSRTKYQQQSSAAGWPYFESHDITKHVFVPFGEWLKRYRKVELGKGTKANWGKYLGTAAFLRWAAKRELLQYHVILLKKS